MKRVLIGLVACLFASPALAQSSSAIQNPGLLANVANTFTQAQTITPAPASTITLDQAQISGGGTGLAVSNATGYSVGQVVTGTNVPLPNQIVSIRGTTQVTKTTSGTAAAGQAVIPIASTTSLITSLQCTDTTAPTVIPPGTLISTITTNTSITLSANITGAGVGSGDTIVCDPVLTLQAPSSAALAAAASLNVYSNSQAFGSAGGAVVTGGITNNGALVTGNVGIGVPAYSNAAMVVRNLAGPGVILKPGSASNTRIPLVGTESTGTTVKFGVTSSGEIVTQANMIVSGGVTGTVAADGTITGFADGHIVFNGSGITDMIECVSDVNGPCLVLRTNALTAGNTFIQTIESNGAGGSGAASWSLGIGGCQRWGTSTTTLNAEDVGLCRNAAGVLEINNGTAGTFADLKLRTVISGGSPPALTGTCTTGSQVGGNTAGAFAATCISQTVIITFATTAPNGWVCNANDMTTPADSLKQSAYTTTSCTLTGTTVALDSITFDARAY